MTEQRNETVPYDFSVTLQGLPPTQVVMVMTTAPDLMLAKHIAHHLVEDGVVACANLGQVCLSMYMWKGELQGDEEVPLTFKTTVARVPELAERLRRAHPYDLPELLCLPVLGGYASYLDWVRTSTATG